MPTIASSSDENSLIQMAASRFSRMFSSSSKNSARSRTREHNIYSRNFVESTGATRECERSYHSRLDDSELPGYYSDNVLPVASTSTATMPNTYDVESTRERNFPDGCENEDGAKGVFWENSLTEKNCDTNSAVFPCFSAKIDSLETIDADHCHVRVREEREEEKQRNKNADERCRTTYFSFSEPSDTTENEDFNSPFNLRDELAPHEWLTQQWNWRLTTAASSSANNLQPQFLNRRDKSISFTDVEEGTSSDDVLEHQVDDGEKQFRFTSKSSTCSDDHVEIAANASLHDLRKLQLTTSVGYRNLLSFRIVAPSVLEEAGDIRSASICKTIEQISVLFVVENVKCISVCCGKILTLADIRVIAKYFRNLENFQVSMCKIEPFALMKNMMLLPRLIALDVTEDPDAWKNFTPKSAVPFAARAEKIMSSFGTKLTQEKRKAPRLKAVRWWGSSGNDFQHMQVLKHLASFRVFDGLISLSVSPAPFVFFRNIKLPSLERLIVCDDCGKNTYSGSYGERETSVKYLWITIGEHCPSVSGFESFLLNFSNLEKIRVTVSSECSSLCTNTGQILYSLRMCKNLKEFHFEDMNWSDGKHKIRDKSPNALCFALRGISRYSKVTIDVVFVDERTAWTNVRDIINASDPRQMVNLRIFPLVDMGSLLRKHIKITPFQHPVQKQPLTRFV